MLHRQPKYECVAAEDTRRQHRQPRQGDGNDEQREPEQVRREYPTRRAQIDILVCLDDRNVKLSREAEDCSAGENQLGHERIRHMIKPKNGIGAACCSGHFSWSFPEENNGKNADCAESQQFDYRLKGNRNHHAFMMFSDINLACAEQDREDGERHGNHQGRVVLRASGCGVIGNDAEAADDGFELQCDVRHRTNRRNNRYQRSQTLRLAVACRDKIGDRCQILPLADHHDAVDQGPAKQNNQHWAEIDRQVTPSVFRGATNRAVECPRRTVDGKREAVDQRAAEIRETALRYVIAPVRDGE